MEETKSAKGWLYLFIGVVLIGCFVFVVAPAVEKQSDTFVQMSTFIDRHEIITGAYVYSDSELVAQAAIGARSTMEHPPVGLRDQ